MPFIEGRSKNCVKIASLEILLMMLWKKSEVQASGNFYYSNVASPEV